MRALLPAVAAAILLSGCLSSAPTARIGASDATLLQIQYDGDAEAVVDGLAERGCVVVSDIRFDCPVETAEGEYTAAVTMDGLLFPLQSQSAGEQPARHLGTDLTHSSATAAAAEHTPSGSGIVSENSVGAHELGSSRTRPPTTVQLRSQTQVLTADGDLVRLGDAADHVLRASLQALLVEGMPVTRADYVDHRFRR